MHRSHGEWYSGDPTLESRPRLSLRPFNGETVERDFEVAGGKATFAPRRQGSFWIPFIFTAAEPPTWDLRLDPGVPIDLKISIGVGAADADLIGTTVSDLDLDAGVGRSVVILPAKGRFRGSIGGRHRGDARDHFIHDGGSR